MYVNEIMTASPVCCDQHQSVQDAARMMLAKDCGILPIVDGQMFLVGVITDRDIACRAVAAGMDTEGIVQEFMTSPVVTVRADTIVQEACRLMEDHQIRRLPVVDSEGRCCGIVSQADFVRRTNGTMVAEMIREISAPGSSAAYMG